MMKRNGEGVLKSGKHEPVLGLANIGVRDCNALAGRDPIGNTSAVCDGER